MPELRNSHQATAHEEVLIEDADQYAMVVGSVRRCCPTDPAWRGHGGVHEQGNANHVVEEVSSAF